MGQAGIQPRVADESKLAADKTLLPDTGIYSSPAQEVTIRDGNHSIKIYTSADTIGAALAENGLAPNGLDYTIPGLENPIPDNRQIRLVRVQERLAIEQSPLPYETKYEPANDVEIDTKKVLQAGQYGIKATSCEGLSIYGNYLGGFNNHSIFLYSSGLLCNVKIFGNFLDGSREWVIYTGSDENKPIVGLQIYGNDFNMQLVNGGAICCANNNTTCSVNKLIISDNNFENSIWSHIRLFGVNSAMITGNIFSAYNYLGVGNNSDIAYCCGVVISSICTNIKTSNNQYGGGVNSLSPTSNNCKYGIYYEISEAGYSINESTIGFGVSGGSVIGGIVQNVNYRPTRNIATLSNSWVSFTPITYYQDLNGIVHVDGITTSGTVGTTLFTLPSKYFPSKFEKFIVASSGTYGVITINTDGTVAIESGNNSLISLSGISFMPA
jgi:hypothetical protein